MVFLTQKKNDIKKFFQQYSILKEKILFNVVLKGKEEIGKSYRWEHTFCYKLVGENEICETDLTGKDQQGGQDILSNETYNFSFWDGHMPYYREDLVFDYVNFSNKFYCFSSICFNNLSSSSGEAAWD
jgi:hypothetical protein